MTSWRRDDFAGVEGCEGSGQEPPPLIGAALLPCAGNLMVSGGTVLILQLLLVCELD